MHGPFEHRRLQRKAMQFLRRLEQEGHAIALAKISLDLRGGGRPADTQVVFELSIGGRGKRDELRPFLRRSAAVAVWLAMLPQGRCSCWTRR